MYPGFNDGIGAMSNGNNLNRRTVLKTISATSIGVGVIDPAAADGEQDLVDLLSKARKPYDSPDTVAKKFNQQTAFMNRLHQDGHLESPEISVNSLDSSCDYIGKEEAARVWGVLDPRGVITAHITIRKKVPSGRLVMAYTPELEDSPRAIFKKKVPDRGSEPVSAVRYKGSANSVTVDKTNIIPKRPGELKEDPEWARSGNGWEKKTPQSGSRTSSMSSSTTSPSSSSQVTTRGEVAFFCDMRGDGTSGCSDGFSCYSWEGECFGEECNIYDCTGEKCCGGCCCCCDQDFCCAICGENECSPHPCDSLQDPICYDSCCNPGGGCGAQICDHCRS